LIKQEARDVRTKGGQKEEEKQRISVAEEFGRTRLAR